MSFIQAALIVLVCALSFSAPSWGQTPKNSEWVGQKIVTTKR